MQTLRSVRSEALSGTMHLIVFAPQHEVPQLKEAAQVVPLGLQVAEADTVRVPCYVETP